MATRHLEEGPVASVPWGFCIELSKKLSKSEEENEAVDHSQLCRTCLAFTILTGFFFADIE